MDLYVSRGSRGGGADVKEEEMVALPLVNVATALAKTKRKTICNCPKREYKKKPKKNYFTDYRAYCQPFHKWQWCTLSPVFHQ